MDKSRSSLSNPANKSGKKRWGFIRKFKSVFARGRRAENSAAPPLSGPPKQQPRIGSPHALQATPDTAVELKHSQLPPRQESLPQVDNTSLMNRLHDLQVAFDNEKQKADDIRAQLQRAEAEKLTLLQEKKARQPNTQAPPPDQKALSNLTNQLREAQSQYAMLRKHLQPNETAVPGDIVKMFTKLSSAINDFCFPISTRIAEACIPTIRESYSSTDGDTQKLRSMLAGAPLLVESVDGNGRPFEEFLECSFRYLIVSALHSDLFSKFHPSLSGGENMLMLNTYAKVRRTEPQLLAGKWRSSALAAFDDRLTRAEWSRTFSKRLEKQINDLLRYLLNSTRPPNNLTDNIRQSLTEIGDIAFKCNTARSSYLALDFEILLFNDKQDFNTTYMIAFGEHDVVLQPPSRIIAAVSLAIISSESFGNERPTAVVCQKKAEVLTEGYFI